MFKACSNEKEPSIFSKKKKKQHELAYLYLAISSASRVKKGSQNQQKNQVGEVCNSQRLKAVKYCCKTLHLRS